MFSKLLKTEWGPAEPRKLPGVTEMGTFTPSWKLFSQTPRDSQEMWVRTCKKLPLWGWGDITATARVRLESSSFLLMKQEPLFVGRRAEGRGCQAGGGDLNEGEPPPKTCLYLNLSVAILWNKSIMCGEDGDRIVTCGCCNRYRNPLELERGEGRRKEGRRKEIWWEEGKEGRREEREGGRQTWLLEKGQMYLLDPGYLLENE